MENKIPCYHELQGQSGCPPPQPHGWLEDVAYVRGLTGWCPQSKSSYKAQNDEARRVKKEKHGDTDPGEAGQGQVRQLGKWRLDGDGAFQRQRLRTGPSDTGHPVVRGCGCSLVLENEVVWGGGLQCCMV